MTGCLRTGPTPDSYMLTDLASGPKTVGIVSSADPSRDKSLPHSAEAITKYVSSHTSVTRWNSLARLFPKKKL
jgi:hypothetical protein